MHVDALDAAAGLAGVEESAVDQRRGGILEVGVGPDVGRVLAALVPRPVAMKCPEAACWIAAPPGTEPVKETKSTTGMAYQFQGRIVA